MYTILKTERGTAYCPSFEMTLDRTCPSQSSFPARGKKRSPNSETPRSSNVIGGPLGSLIANILINQLDPTHIHTIER